MPPPAAYIGPWKAVEEEFIWVSSTWDVLNEVARLSPENQSFKVVRDMKSDLRQQELPLHMGSKKSFHSA